MKKLRLIAAAWLVAIVAVGCGAEVATCSEYASMHPETGLLVPLNNDQEQALKVALEEAGFDDGGFNIMIAGTEVMAYCNIYAGVANQNQNEPITNAM